MKNPVGVVKSDQIEMGSRAQLFDRCLQLTLCQVEAIHRFNSASLFLHRHLLGHTSGAIDDKGDTLADDFDTEVGRRSRLARVSLANVGFAPVFLTRLFTDSDGVITVPLTPPVFVPIVRVGAEVHTRGSDQKLHHLGQQ